LGLQDTQNQASNKELRENGVNTKEHYSRYIKMEYGSLVGKTVEQVRTLTDTELEQFMWDGGGSEVAFVVFFTDGSFIIPSRDEEANGAGALIYEPATA
jgi:hypothetical protein